MFSKTGQEPRLASSRFCPSSDVCFLKHRIFYLSFDADCLYPLGMDMEKDETDSSLRPLFNGFFMVHTGNLVRIRLLSLHGLALQSADEIGTL